MKHRCPLALAAALVMAFTAPASAVEAHQPSAPTVTVLNNTALDGFGAGSTVGPDGAIYVPNPTQGTLVRIHPRTGEARVVGSGLPLPNGGFGAFDAAFIGQTAYALVTLAGADIGQDAVMGIYKLGSDGTFSAFADIGTWASTHLPADPDWFLSQGVQWSMEVWRDGFLVTDAHHAKVFRVDRHGTVSDMVAFASTDAVPLGLEVAQGKIYLSTAGPIPHVPSTSKINRVGTDGSVEEIAGWGADYAGNRGLIVDVEANRRGQLFGLLQGHWDLEPIDVNEGLPAAPNTGEIVFADQHGTFQPVIGELNQPTSLEFVGNAAFVVTLDGSVLRIDGM